MQRSSKLSFPFQKYASRISGNCTTRILRSTPCSRRRADSCSPSSLDRKRTPAAPWPCSSPECGRFLGVRRLARLASPGEKGSGRMRGARGKKGEGKERGRGRGKKERERKREGKRQREEGKREEEAERWACYMHIMPLPSASFTCPSFATPFLPLSLPFLSPVPPFPPPSPP